MDLDWCLSCGRHVNGTATYCSRECLSRDDPFALSPTHIGPSESLLDCDSDDGELDDVIIYHEIKSVPPVEWIGNGPAGILAWAAGIPSGAAGAPSPNDPISPTPPSPPPTAPRIPKLLLPHKRPIPPTLCMSTPATAYPQPSFPIFTPQRHMAALSLNPSQEVDNGSKTSLQSAVTEPFVVTPSSANASEPLPCPSKPSMLNALATLRSWVAPCNTPSSPPPNRAAVRPKPPPRVRNVDQAVFTVLAKTHRSPALPVLHVHSSASSSMSKMAFLDGLDSELPSWWIASTAHSPSPSGAKKGFSRLMQARHVALDLRVCTDYLPYASRGRKTSRVAT